MLTPNFVFMAESRELQQFLLFNVGASDGDVTSALLGLYNVLVKNQKVTFFDPASLASPTGFALETNVSLVLAGFVDLISQEKLPVNGKIPKTVKALSLFVDLLILCKKTIKEPISVVKFSRGGSLTYSILKNSTLDLCDIENRENFLYRYTENNNLTDVENVILLIKGAIVKFTPASS